MREVNYVQFCQEVDDLVDLNASPDKKGNATASTTYVPNDVISDVKNLDLLSNLYLSKRLGVNKAFSKLT